MMRELVGREENSQDATLYKFILLVEDNELLGTLLVTAVNQQGKYCIIHVKDGESALEVVKHLEPDVLVLDYHLPDMNGIELYEHIHERNHYVSIPTIFASADFPYTVALKARTLRLDKPFSIQQFLNAIYHVLL